MAKATKPLVLRHVHPNDDPEYTTRRVPRRAGTPMPWAEVILRLENVFNQCSESYHFYPSKEDREALARAVAVLRRRRRD